MDAVRCGAAAIPAQGPRQLGRVLDRVARAQAVARGQERDQRGRGIRATEPLALVDDRALPRVRGRHEQLATGRAQPVDDGQQLAGPPHRIEQVERDHAVVHPVHERRVERIAADQGRAVGREVAGSRDRGRVVPADGPARVAQWLAREQPAGAAHGAELEIEADHVIRAARELRGHPADAAAELDREPHAVRGALGEPGDERARGRDAGAAARAVGHRLRAVAPVVVEIDRQVLDEARVGCVVGPGCDELSLDLRREVALDDRRHLGREVTRWIGEHDRHAVDHRVAPAALAREHVAVVPVGRQRAHVDPLGGARATTRADQDLHRRVSGDMVPLIMAGSSKEKLHAEEQTEASEDREVYLRDGKKLVIGETGGNQLVEIRSESGALEVRIELTDQGPVLRMESVKLELKAEQSIELESQRVAIKAGQVSIESEDAVDVDAKGDVRVAGKLI